jgi:outer membrane protein assembly factor BamB
VSATSSRAAAALCVLGACALGACSSTVRRTEQPVHEYPGGVTQILWRNQVHEHALFEPRPEECSSGAVVGDRLVIGSRAGNVLALGLNDGQVLWSTPVTGSIDAEARYDDTHKQVYLGTDDGMVYALEPAGGKIRWSYKTRGAVERRPELGGDSVFFSTAGDRVVALDPRTGKALWQYEREPPEGFTIHGHGGPRLSRGVVYAGFSDGVLVALNAGTGDVVWSRSLAAASEQYVDVDATPALLGNELVLGASYSGGLYALAASNGELKWRLNVEGASGVQVIGQRLFFAAPRDGLTALTDTGEVLWRQGLADAGDLSTPFAVGNLLVFSGSRAGLFFVDRATGRLVELFNPGRGMCASATLGPDGQTLYVLANSGTLYAVRLNL